MQDSDLIKFEEISTIKVEGSDSKINNQDTKKIYVSKYSEELKRTSDFMLGNDGKNLQDGDYINADEFLNATKEALNSENVKKIIMKKTGKKVSTKDLDKIVELAKKSGTIVLKENDKIKNQDARLVSIKTPSMEKEANVAGMMLGKKGPQLSNGEYVQKEELEFEVVSKKRVPVALTPTPPGKINLSPNKLKLIKGLSTLAVSVGLVALVPYILHANSVTWHHVGPEAQKFLHTINLGLGKMIQATYHNKGLWESAQNIALNADAPTASLVTAVATYGVTAAGLTKIVSDIKNGITSITNKIRNKEEQEKTDEENLGGKSR